jgi:hypothetical protein
MSELKYVLTNLPCTKCYSGRSNIDYVDATGGGYDTYCTHFFFKTDLFELSLHNLFIFVSDAQ